MTDIPKLIAELDMAGAEWGSDVGGESYFRGLCRQAAAALKEQSQSKLRAVEFDEPDATLRDEFAMIALAGLLEGDKHALPPETCARLAILAYAIADACLKVRKL